MKHLITLVSVFLIIQSGFSQDTDYKTYSFSDLFGLIQSEEDSVFELKDAFIIFNSETDSRFWVDLVDREFIYPDVDSIIVNRELHFENVHNITRPSPNGFAGLTFIDFKKKAQFIDCTFSMIRKCTFKDFVDVQFTSKMPEIVERIDNSDEVIFSNISFTFETCTFYNGVQIISDSDRYHRTQCGIGFSDIWPRSDRKRGLNFRILNHNGLWLEANTFHGNSEGLINIRSNGSRAVIERNDFTDNLMRILISSEDYRSVDFTKNVFNKPVLVQFGDLNMNHEIDWAQFSSGLINDRNYQSYYFNLNYNKYDSIGNFEPSLRQTSTKNIEHYLNRVRIEHMESYKAEMKFRGKLYNLYDQQHDSYFANAAYVDMKDLETQHLAFVNSQNPSFNSFFTLKINQFLEHFSLYGTQPARAIIFSMYVILFFALIYLFFPNSWDSHRKNRIIDRYTFFMKYMNKNAGIHEVYLEDKQPELLGYDSFKEYIETNGQHVPRFFKATALPLYKWAISGTKFSAAFLQRIDIMKGTWSDLPKSKRVGKSILLVGAFLIAVLYGIIIKVLNALMLSINTFTTLGFGEIPIKGLPRYLAIIQGFIGWFMLTIFSVSLISQLLN